AVGAGVGRDGEEPGRNLGPAVVLMRPRDHLDEHLLGHFFGRAAVREQTVGEPEESGRVALEELGGPARVPPANPFQQRPVGRACDLPAIHDPTGTAIEETQEGGRGYGSKVQGPGSKVLSRETLDFGLWTLDSSWSL